MLKPVPKVPDFPGLERRVLEFWQRERIFEALKAQNAGRPRWSFLDGPITANNPMGVHHAWGRSLKDMFQRFHAMNGEEERFQNGFDCQGLWVEVEVEKSLGLRTKADIKELGVERFVRECKERVLTFAAKQTEQSIRLGHWCNWDPPESLLRLRDALHDGDQAVRVTAASGRTLEGRASALIGALGTPEFGGSYFTFSDENNYTIWAFLRKCHDQGFLYRGHDVMPWCGRCGTGLSQMEVAEGRRIVAHPAAFVRFPLLDRPHEALLIWTTTPWTLTSNVAVAVHPEMTYLAVRHGEWTYYVGKDNFTHERVQDLQAEGKRGLQKLPSIRTILKGSGAPVEVREELPGSALVGWRYRGPFDELPAQTRPGGLFPFATTTSAATAAESHRVIPWKEISGTEGTGLVHIAPGCGAEDAQLGLEHGLVFIAPLDESAVFLEGFGPFSGRQAGEVADDVFHRLHAAGLLVAREHYPHVYPHCWRCKEELVFRPVDEWFIRMDWRDRIQRIVPDIRWIPPDGEARELDWLKNMGDWMISKKRFWGLALPIWLCEACGHFMVIGGREELRERALEGWERFDGHSPHRPHVDAVKIRCEKCGSRASRIEDVGNPWLDAGIVPFSTLRFDSQPEYWRQWFPAELVLECFPGQFRNWFYSLLAMSAMMDGRAPFRTLLGHALVRDARGEEMHKSKGNAVSFDEAVEALGAEVMRYMFAAQNPTQNLNFPDVKPGKSAGATLDAEVRRKLLTFWNCYGFFVTYAAVEGWRPGAALPPRERGELDRWILSRVQDLVRSAREAFADYALFRLVAKLEQFDEDLSNWYIRRSRRRFWSSGPSADKDSAFQTLYEVLKTTVQVWAPILPFLSEEIYQNLVRSLEPDAPLSVHLTPYPQPDAALVNEALERKIATLMRIRNLAFSLRTQGKVRIRQPLSRLVVRPRDASEREILRDPGALAEILEEANVKRLELIDDEAAIGGFAIRPAARSLAPKAGRHMKAVAAALARADTGEVLAALDRDGVYVLRHEEGALDLTAADLAVEFRGPENVLALRDQGTFVALDASLSPALVEEGLARDLNRLLQEQRKRAGLAVSDSIRLRIAAGPPVVAAIEAHRGYLEEELLAQSIEVVPSLADGTTLEMGGERVSVVLEAVRGS